MNIETQDTENKKLPSEKALMLVFWGIFYTVLIISMVIFFAAYIYSFGINFLFYLFIISSAVGLFPIFHPKLRKSVFQDRLGTASGNFVTVTSHGIYP